MKDESGNIVIEDTAVKEVWRRYMERLMNIENTWNGMVGCEVKVGPRWQLSQTELEYALKQCDQGTAAGPSGVAVELIAASGKLGVEWMTTLGNSILDEDVHPIRLVSECVGPTFQGKGRSTCLRFLPGHQNTGTCNEDI